MEAYNRPGRSDRQNARAPGVLRELPIRPRKLGHVVIGTSDAELRNASSSMASGSR